MIFTLILIAVVVGALMPVQAGVNAQLTRILQNPYLTATISFTTGSIALFLLSLAKGVNLEEVKRMSSVSPHLYVGGILGAIFVSSTIFLIPKMGATTMIAAFITGQLLMSVLIDHYGLLGLAVTPISMTRILGVILLFAGLFLVVKKGT